MMRSRRYDALRLEALARDNHTCQLCGQPATQVDHKWSVVMGGSTTIDNLQAVCEPCNSRKFMQSTGEFPGEAEVQCRHCMLGEVFRRELCRPCYLYKYRNGRLPPKELLDKRLTRFVAATNPGEPRHPRR